jgi:hypothetical protein
MDVLIKELRENPPTFCPVPHCPSKRPNARATPSV